MNTRHETLYIEDRHELFEVCELINPTEEIARDIGRELIHLSDAYDGSAVDLGYLEEIARLPSAVQFVARVSAGAQPRVISELRQRHPVLGVATISTLQGTLSKKAWLEDFVVTPEARKYRVAQMIWDASIDWRTERNLLQMRFTSAPDKVRAHSFYKRNGCEIIAKGKTALFVHNIETGA